MQRAKAHVGWRSWMVSAFVGSTRRSCTSGSCPRGCCFPQCPLVLDSAQVHSRPWQPLANESCWPGGRAFLWRHVLVLAGRASATPKDLSGAASFPRVFSGKAPSASWTLVKDNILGIFQKALQSVLTFSVSSLKSSLETAYQGPQVTQAFAFG